MTQDIPIFKPRYPMRMRLLILGLPAFFFVMLCSAAIALIQLHFVFWLLVLITGIVASLIPFFIIREIRFLDEMVVRRHFLPDKFFSYKELEQINEDSIQAKGQRIPMGPIVNLEELKNMAQRWKAGKILSEAQRPRPKKESLYLQRGYGTFASFWGLLFGVIFVLIKPAWLQVDPRWLLGGTFLVVYILYVYVVPKYL